MQLNRKQKQIFAFLAAAFVLLSLAGFLIDGAIRKTDSKIPKEQVEFSHESGFYTETIFLELKTGERGDILYTLDGSNPSGENENAFVYDHRQGIVLECSETEQVYTVKAAVFGNGTEQGAGSGNGTEQGAGSGNGTEQGAGFGNGTEQGAGFGDGTEQSGSGDGTNTERDTSSGSGEDSVRICTGTYIVGSGVRERYDIPVLSISGDPADLFGEEGILPVENRYFRGREYEKEVRATLFDLQGEEAFAQNCGLRVYGSSSRGKNQPSLRLYARSEYDENKTFHYYFFEDDYGADNVRISDYKRIILRNGGDDNGYAYLRNELGNRLSGEAGFPDVQHASPVCVYINGEYFGVYWFINNYDDRYFEEKYGEYDGRMVVLEGQTSGLYEQEEEDETEKLIREEYNAFYAEASSLDLNVDENWERLNKTVDVENFLQYMALENYVCNQDYMVNNFRAYRYYSPKGEYEEGTVFDGRYRYLLFDLDESFGFAVHGGEGTGPEALRTASCLGDISIFSKLFNNIMTRPEGREIYIRYYLSLANYYFAPEQSLAVMAQMHESHGSELKYLYNETELLAGNADTPENTDYGHVLNELDIIASFLEERPAFALQDLSVSFGLQQAYKLLLANENQANITLDNAVFHDAEYEGFYFQEVPVRLSASPQCGYRFDYWLVNGNRADTETLEIGPEMIEDGFVGIECVTSPDPEAGLVITAIKSRGLGDYIVLENFGTEELNLKYYFLTDKAEEGRASSLPSMRLAPGESVTVYCSNYTRIDALGKPGINFNLKAGETLELYKSDGTFLQAVEVPRLSSGESIYRLDPYSGAFYEEVHNVSESID